MRYLFIISVNTDPQELHKLEDVVSTLDESLRSSIEIRYAEYPGQAADLASEASDLDGRNVTVVACGGDSSVHEIVNALAFHTTPLIVFPIGLSNDFARSFMPDYLLHDPTLTVKLFEDIKVKAVDLVRLDSYDVLGNHLPVWSKYFVNIASVGFDTCVLMNAEEIRERKGITTNTQKAFFRGMRQAVDDLRPFKLDYDLEVTDSDENEVCNGGTFAGISICNGRYGNNGFLKAPDAKINDGVLDVVVTGYGSRMSLLKGQMRSRLDKAPNQSEVKIFRATSGIITCRDNSFQLLGNYDGEPFYGHRIRFEVFPESLNLAFFPSKRPLGIK